MTIAIHLKSAANWRALVHQVVGIVVPLVVTFNLTSEDVALAWVPFIFAITDNVLSSENTADRRRRTIYAAAAVLQTGGLLTTMLTSYFPQYVSIGGAMLAVFTALLARFYTPTTALRPTTGTPLTPAADGPFTRASSTAPRGSPWPT